MIIILSIVFLGVVWLALVIILLCFIRQKLRKRRIVEKDEEGITTVGIFQPYCNIGSGKERVLWTAVKTLLSRYPTLKIFIYTGDTDCSPQNLRSNAAKRFGICVPSNVEFIYLHRRKWLDASNYPIFTLIGQAFGSIYLVMEALFKIVPDVMLDTTGFPFAILLFKYLGGSKTGCYVSNPDLLPKMSTRSDPWSSNVRNMRSSNPIKSCFRCIYIQVITKLYSLAGRSSDIIMVNSSWTEEHLNAIWHRPSKTFRVYPPCGTDDFSDFVSKEEGRDSLIKIISISSFRSEKDHPLQIRTMYQLREMLREHEWNRVHLVLIGNCTDPEDYARVKDMEDLCKHLSVEKNVQFKINMSREELKEELKEGLIGIHTMVNERFGIGIVECMAAGLIMVANRSGGPMMDIVMEYDGSRTGFLANDEHDYAEALRCIILMTPESRAVLRSQAQASVDRFSDRQFIKPFLEATESLFR